MSDLRDLSRLPVDERYWTELEARIMSDLGPRVRASGGVPSGWWAPLGARAWTLGGLALAASVGALLLVPPRESASPRTKPELLASAAIDPALVTFVKAPAPPPLATLLLPRQER